MTSFSRLSLALAVLACLTLAPSAAAEVYKWVDENGVVHYTDRPAEAGLETTEIDVPAIPEAQARATEAADPQSATPWYEQWLTEQRERRLAEQQARVAASAKKGGEQAQLLEECIQARRRLTILQTPCRVFFDGRGVLRNRCAGQITYAYAGEFRYLEDAERAAMIRHYRKKADECEAAGY